MSSTTLYVIERDGSISERTSYSNSHGSAPAVWSALSAKYIPNTVQVGERWHEGQRHWMLGDPPASDDLWKLANAGGMQDFERRTCWMTYDRACVRTNDLLLYADALAEFDRVYGPIHERLGLAFHIGKMADDLRAVHADAEANGWRGVAWNQTSLADTWVRREPPGVEDEYDDGIPDNVDAFGCTWLPSAGVEVLSSE